jgi:hypothetical protein
MSLDRGQAWHTWRVKLGSPPRFACGLRAGGTAGDLTRFKEYRKGIIVRSNLGSAGNVG